MAEDEDKDEDENENENENQGEDERGSLFALPRSVRERQTEREKWVERNWRLGTGAKGRWERSNRLEKEKEPEFGS